MQTQFNICHIVLSLDVGGLEKVVCTIATEQIKLGHNVIIFCLDNIGLLGEQLSTQYIEIICLNRKPGFLDKTVLQKMRTILRNNKINVIHTHNIEPNLYGMIASILSNNIKTIHTQHGIPDKFNFVKKTFLKFTGFFLKKFVSVSDTAAENAINYGWVPSPKVDVIINGIDTDAFTSNSNNKTKFREEYNLPKDAIILTTISRIEPVKDHTTMIEQFSIVAKQMTNVYLIIVGDGSKKQEISELIIKHKLTARVIMTGMQIDVKKYLQMADIFLMTSISEGISISLLEGMSSKLIPIVTPVGGNTQIVENNQCGYILDIKQPESLCTILNKILNDSKLFKTISDNARKKVIAKFSKEAMMNKYMALYKKL